MFLHTPPPPPFTPWLKGSLIVCKWDETTVRPGALAPFLLHSNQCQNLDYTFQVHMSLQSLARKTGRIKASRGLRHIKKEQRPLRHILYGWILPTCRVLAATVWFGAHSCVTVFRWVFSLYRVELSCRTNGMQPLIALFGGMASWRSLKGNCRGEI